MKKSNQTLAEAKVIDAEFIGYYADKPFPKTYYKLETISPISDFNNSSVSSGILSKDSRLKPQVSYSYNSKENLIGYSKTNGISNAYQWSSSGNQLFAEVQNASSSQIFYTSFEEGEFDDSQAKTGRQSIYGDYVFTPPTGFTPAAGSVLSYWYYENGAWRYKEQPYSGGSVTLALGEMIDEVRIHPANAHMSTYTYDPYRHLSLSSASSPDGTTTYYEHDVLGRLKTLRGLNREIIKSYLYHYEE